jgi:hypothetical protein
VLAGLIGDSDANGHAQVNPSADADADAQASPHLHARAHPNTAASSHAAASDARRDPERASPRRDRVAPPSVQPSASTAAIAELASQTHVVPAVPAANTSSDPAVLIVLAGLILLGLLLAVQRIRRTLLRRK